jgi:hypothetical protein
VRTVKRLTKAALLIVLAAFHLHNFVVYDPRWGYDGASHILMVSLYARSVEFNPVALYAGTNPPLYYLLAGKILSAFDSLKVVQALSLLLFSLNLTVMWIALRRVCRDSPLRWPILVFFAVNPLHLAYAYMVFNYSLAQAIAIGFVGGLLILAVRVDLPRPLLVASGLGLAAAAGVWTSLTNLALLPIGGVFLLLHPALTRRTRILAIALFLGVGLAAIAPYVALKNLEEGCVLCTRNRPVTTHAFYEVYPARYYYWVSLRPFHQPHVPHFWKDGMWPVLYQTYFGDYFNYLVGPRYALIDRDPALVKVGPHSTDAGRDGKLELLNYLGLPLAAAMLAALALAVWNSWRYLRTRHPGLFVDLIVCVSSVIYLAQFLAYIHRYPDYVNIHAGYLFPITAPLWIQVGHRLAPGPDAGPTAKILFAALTLYSALAAATFFLR